MNSFETSSFRQSPEALKEKEALTAKFDATSARADLLISKYRTDQRVEDSFMSKLPDTESKIIASQDLFTRKLSFSNVPPEQQNPAKDIQRSFDALGRAGLQVSKELQRVRKEPLKEEQKRFLVGGFYKDFLVAKTNINTSLAGAPSAAEEVHKTIAEYETLLPEECAALFTTIDVGSGDAHFEKQLNTTGQMALVVLGGAYTLFALITGMKTKNYTPAIIGAVATAAAIFGTKRLFEGAGSRVVREMEPLATDEYDEFFDRFVEKGKEDEAATYIEALAKNPPNISRITALRKSNRPPEEKEGELTKLLALDSASDSIKAKVQEMANNGNTNDLSILIQLAERGTHKDTKKMIVEYIRKGGRSKDIKIAKDPTKALEEEARRVG